MIFCLDDFDVVGVLCVKDLICFVGFGVCRWYWFFNLVL